MNTNNTNTVLIMEQFIANVMPTSWSALVRPNRGNVNQLGNNTPVTISVKTRLREAWQSRKSWMIRFKMYIFDFRSSYFGENLDEFWVSDVSDVDDSDVNEDELYVE
jgi:hypothetical protein